MPTPQIAPKRVVCVSWLSTLAYTREMLLREAGCQVTSIVGAEQIEKLRAIHQTDLLVLAHSVPRTDKQRVIEILQQTSKAPILSLLRPHQEKLPQADFAVEATSPADFVRVVREILAA